MDIMLMHRYQAPWRIIPFAMFFNLIFAIITTYVTADLEKGYEEFTKDVKNIFLKISSIYEIPKNIRCETSVITFYKYFSN